MYLEKVNEVRFEKQLVSTKKELSPEYTRYSDMLTGLTAGLIFFCVTTVSGLLGAGHTTAWLISLCALVFSFFGSIKFFNSNLYFPRRTRKWLNENNAELKSLQARVRQFNRALEAQKDTQRLLVGVERSDESMLANYWEERREVLQKEADDFHRRFASAVSEDLRKKNLLRAKDWNNPKLLREGFQERVARLQELEKSLAGLQDSGDYQGTQDLSPFLAAAKLREQLEMERIALGLPQKALPKPKAKKLLLAARND